MFIEHLLQVKGDNSGHGEITPIMTSLFSKICSFEFNNCSFSGAFVLCVLCLMMLYVILVVCGYGSYFWGGFMIRPDLVHVLFCMLLVLGVDLVFSTGDTLEGCWGCLEQWVSGRGIRALFA